jgi:uncharacterized iron-regulated membrane protein
MKGRNYKYFIRKSHRYLGIFIGVQFLLWTLGGLYFSWTNINEIRGENLRKEKENLFLPAASVSPQMVIDEISRTKNAPEITKIQVVEILGESFYEIKYRSGKKTETVLANLTDGKIRPPVTEDEAKKIAAESLIAPQKIKQTEYLTAENTSAHHEYRERPLPAWAVTFENNLTVYLTAETGQIQTFRTNEWRVYDFLWMLHTMGFEDRDNLNNYLLRTFSVLGIVTILSGFLLFFASSKFFRKLFFSKRAASAG